jgi:hypothetical protein
VILRSTDIAGALRDRRSHSAPRQRQRGFFTLPGGMGAAKPAGGGSDPYFANVVLGMNMTGVDGATDTTDFSDSAHTFTFLGDAQIDTSGGQSLLLDGTGDRVDVVGTGSDFAFGTGDFAVEIWFAGTDSEGGLIVQSESGTGWALFLTAGDVYWQNRYNSQNLIIRSTIASGVSILNGTLAQVVVARSGSDNRMFHRGIQVGATVTNSEDYESTTGPSIGWGGSGFDSYLICNVFAVRITKGSDRGYTANFTPPVPPLPTS